ncbi:MAG: VOC family protein [Chloroflexi bacterium]|nr:VOC family protein [Chloroflexota bacterium]
MPRRIHHAGITVADLERSIAFYRDVLGLTVLGQYERTTPDIGEIVGYPGAHLRIAFVGVAGDSPRIELLQYVTPSAEGRGGETNVPGAGHVCFDVDDIDAVFRRLTVAGYPPRSKAPVELTQGPNSGVKALYVRDPDGYTIELRQPLDAR